MGEEFLNCGAGRHSFAHFYDFLMIRVIEEQGEEMGKNSRIVELVKDRFQSSFACPCSFLISTAMEKQAEEVGKKSQVAEVVKDPFQRSFSRPKTVWSRNGSSERKPSFKSSSWYRILRHSKGAPVASSSQA